jgi:hypothetical protein
MKKFWEFVRRVLRVKHSAVQNTITNALVDSLPAKTFVGLGLIKASRTGWYFSFAFLFLTYQAICFEAFLRSKLGRKGEK